MSSSTPSSLAGRDDIPVAAGAWRPIVGNAKADMEAPVNVEKQLIARYGDRLKTFNPKAPPPDGGRPATPRRRLHASRRCSAAPGEITRRRHRPDDQPRRSPSCRSRASPPR